MRAIALLVWLVFVPLPAIAESDGFTLYLVRHAEKAADGSTDPPLIGAGHRRVVMLTGWLADRRVEADRKPAACSHHRPGELPFSRANVEHPPEAIGELERKRNDLFDIFGIDAVGELPLPPVGVLVPERLTHQAKHA